MLPQLQRQNTYEDKKKVILDLQRCMNLKELSDMTGLSIASVSQIICRHGNAENILKVRPSKPLDPQKVHQVKTHHKEMTKTQMMRKFGLTPHYINRIFIEHGITPKKHHEGRKPRRTNLQIQKDKKTTPYEMSLMETKKEPIQRLKGVYSNQKSLYGNIYDDLKL